MTDQLERSLIQVQLQATLGLITNVQIKVEGVPTLISLFVFYRESDCIILGNSWFKINRTYPDVDQDELVMRRPFGRVVTRLESIKRNRTDKKSELLSIILAEEIWENHLEGIELKSEELSAPLDGYDDIFQGLGKTDIVEHQMRNGHRAENPYHLRTPLIRCDHFGIIHTRISTLAPNTRLQAKIKTTANKKEGMAERRLITPIPWYGITMEDLVGWLRSFENAVKANNWNDTTACRVVGSYCLCNAATWYQRQEAELDTWEKFRAAFLRQYKTEFREEVWRT
ncbi:uncharacterized protein VTP21DRAFT_5635 [Calcarisporiella thermophila]|uniref:uncharacterized protein n=1 Tax=Calcarisporiella thermophila TaxID=911321 RepID=UPI00374301B5